MNSTLGGGEAHGSHAEFESTNLVEREADFFATGLLMPRYLLQRQVNVHSPSFDDIRNAAREYNTSLTSMMIRWVQLCDFSCAVASVKQEKIEWGFTSSGFKRIGGWQVKCGERVGSRQAKSFLKQKPALNHYREGDGWSVASRWINFDYDQLEVHETYIVIPSTQQMLVFITANEDDLGNSSPWE